MSRPEVVVYANRRLWRPTTAARLVTRLVDIQAAGRVPVVVLTGGGVGIDLLAHQRLPGPGRRRLAAGRDLLGRRAFRAAAESASATRGRPGTRCWTRSSWTRRGCT